MIFQNPDKFVTGEIHSYRLEWEPILEGIFKKALEINPFVYHSDGVRVAELLVPFKGDFEGKFYNCPIPLCAVFHSSKLCENFEEFFTAIILDRVGIGEVVPPHRVIPMHYRRAHAQSHA